MNTFRFAFIGILLFVLLLLTACSSTNQDTYYTDPEGKIYKHKLVLTGTMPNAVSESTIVILTNDDTITFDRLVNKLFSSRYDPKDVLEFYYLGSE